MSDDYALVTDASADLTPDFVECEHVHVIPMTYMLGDEERTCCGMESPEVLKWYYDGQREGKITRTSQISPEIYASTFRTFAEKGQSVLYLSLSSGLSGTYNTSKIAAQKIMEEFPEIKIYCVDSLSASGGMHLLLEKAAKNRKLGMNLEDNVKWLEENRLNVCHWFMVEDLIYLRRNGRISPTTAFLGSLLNIKPILRIENDGTLNNFLKKRGVKATLNEMIRLYNDASKKEKNERIYVLHTDNQASADYLEQEIKNLNPECVITKNMLTPIIGCHVGPNFCAIVHFGKRI